MVLAYKTKQEQYVLINKKSIKHKPQAYIVKFINYNSLNQNNSEISQF